jgi:4-diphosphocytidyl-2-C-methyl-D-erythritol kinase
MGGRASIPSGDVGALPVVRIAPAKINLTLSVGPRRGDGFHDLHSVMVPLAFGDRLSLARAHGPDDTLHVVGEDGPPRDDDLVLRGIAAARRTARALVGPGADLFPLAARLEKRIPIAAGLGGGSSDAAAALDAALDAWALGQDVPEAERIAAAMTVGSDVPFFLAAGPALVEGRGDRLTPLRAPIAGADGPIGILVVTPVVPVSTAHVFRRLDEGGDGAAADPRSTRITSEHLAQELGAGLHAEQLIARAGVLATANDLVSAAAAIVPELRTVRRAIARRLGRPVGQSGSGPSLWALYPSSAAAERAAQDLEAGFRDGSLAAPGDQPPRVIASTIIGREP